MDDVQQHNHIVKKTRQEIIEEESQLMLKKSKEKDEDLSALELIKSTMYLMYSDKAAILLVMITLHYGAIQGLARGLFNASWVSCALGEFFYVVKLIFVVYRYVYILLRLSL